MANILGIDHIQFSIPPGCEPQGRQFYGEVLGLREIPKPLELAGRGGAWFDCGAFELHLGVEADFSPSKKAHAALRVDDLDAYLARLTAANCFVDLSQPQLSGIKRAFTKDPFGNRIELTQVLA